MTIEDFTNYYHRNAPSGKPYTPDLIAALTGWRTDYIQTLTAFLDEHYPNLSNTDIVRNFNQSYTLIPEPFGLSINKKPGTAPGTVAELKAKIQAVLDATN